MTIENIIQELKIDVFAGAENLNRNITGAYASDMLSDVMGRAKDGNIWITMQTHKNIIAVASLKDVAAILIVNGGKPDDNTIISAEKEGIVLLGTKEKTFESCGKIFKILERNAVV